MSRSGRLVGLAGVVIEARCAIPARSPAPIRGGSAPSSARGSAPAYSTWEKPGSMSVPVVVGGRLVSPGDVVVANADGVAVLPCERLDEAVKLATAFLADARGSQAELDSGRTRFEILGLAASVEALRLDHQTRG